MTLLAMRSVTFSMPEWLVAALDELAVADRRCRSDVLRIAAEEWVTAQNGAAHPRQAGSSAAASSSAPRVSPAPTPIPPPQPSYSSEPAGWDEPDPLDSIA